MIPNNLFAWDEFEKDRGLEYLVLPSPRSADPRGISQDRAKMPNVAPAIAEAALLPEPPLPNAAFRSLLQALRPDGRRLSHT